MIKLCGLLRYVDGDYKDSATFQAIRKELGSAQRPAHYLAIPPALFELVVEQLAKADCSQGARVIDSTLWVSARAEYASRRCLVKPEGLARRTGSSWMA